MLTLCKFPPLFQSGVPFKSRSVLSVRDSQAAADGYRMSSDTGIKFTPSRHLVLTPDA